MGSAVRSWRGPLVVVLCLADACAGRAVGSAPKSELAPRDFYPMTQGNAWSYDVDTGQASTTLAIVRVEAFDGRIAEVRTGQAVVRYEVRPEGIRIPSQDVWLLRAPLREGATWLARGGRMARLVSMQARTDGEAGRLEHCIEVLETGGALELEVRTVYCAGIGPISVRSTMKSKVSERTVTVSARLRGYDVRPPEASDP